MKTYRVLVLASFLRVDETLNNIGIPTSPNMRQNSLTFKPG